MQLCQRQTDGAPLREHLLAEARMTGETSPLLRAELPAWAGGLWQAYTELADERQAGMGPCGIQGTQILAWQRLAGVRLTPWEVDTLRAVDRAVLACQAGKAGVVS